MVAKKVTLNGIVGLLLVLLSAVAFYWTYSMRLRPYELFIPRIALGLIILGGLLIFFKDIVKHSEVKEELSKEFILPYAVGVSLSMWLYGWAFRNIGIVTSTVVFLSSWWIWVVYRDAKRKGSIGSFGFTAVKYVVLAAIIAAVIYFLFIFLLRMYLPRTLLP